MKVEESEPPRGGAAGDGTQESGAVAPQAGGAR